MRKLPNVTKIVSIGFAVIFVLLLLLLLFWNRNNAVNDERLSFVIGENEEVRLLTETLQMVQTTRALLYRAAAVGAVSAAHDPAAVLRELHQRFDAMSAAVTNGDFDEAEKALWKNIHPLLHRYDAATERTIELVRQGQRQQALREVENEIEPTQRELRAAIAALTQNKTTQIDSDLAEAKQSTTQNNVIFWVLLMSLLVVAGFMWVAIKRTVATERQIRFQGDRIRALFEISASSGMSVEQQIEATLKLGSVVFGLPIAKVSKINGADNVNETIYLHAPEPMCEKLRAARPLSDTFCSIVFANEQTLAVQHIGATELRQHPSYAKTGVETYIAAPMFVNNVKYGTVAFAAMAPRAQAFSAADIDFMTLLGKWISASIERKQTLEIASEKQVAVAANRAKSVFLAHMSHEIRTPLTAIIGFAETALDAAQSEQERKEAMATIIRSGRILLQIINDILDLSKIEANKLEVEHAPLSLFEVVSEVKAILEPKAREKGLVFGVNYYLPLPKSIDSDPVRLKQILLNLGANAIKFTPRGHVQFDIGYDHSDQLLTVGVVDSGIGLSAEQQQKLFNAFVQADPSTTRKYGGTGLGLSLSRQLAALLGGTITVVSESERGSKFSLNLPVSKAAQTQLITQLSDIPQPAPDTLGWVPDAPLSGEVLVVEDTLENQKLIALILSRMGINVQVVSNGQEALDVLSVAGHGIELVLMDMQMPVMDGYTAMQRLREQGCTVPIIALTANAMLEEKKRVLELGANDYLTKPIDRVAFHKTIARYLARIPPEHAQADYLESLLLADDPTFIDLVRSFVNRLPGMVSTIQTLAQQRDWAQLRNQVHELKGVGGNLGYPQLTELAKEMEQVLRSEQTSRLTPLLATLDMTCGKIVRGVANGQGASSRME